MSEQYSPHFEGAVIRGLVRIDNQERKDSDAPGARQIQRAIYRIWPDFKIKALINRSLATVKADAARSSFSAAGQGIVWAVMDSGIDRNHPHFAAHDTLTLSPALPHQDFTVLNGPGDALRDDFGHGTHVAGIIAGEIPRGAAQHVVALARHRDELGEITFDRIKLDTISGMAPQCRLLSLKVLDGSGQTASNLIAAIATIQQMNGFGRRISARRHHERRLTRAEWFACGQSPLRVGGGSLVRSGAVVSSPPATPATVRSRRFAAPSPPAGPASTIARRAPITVGATIATCRIYGAPYFVEGPPARPSLPDAVPRRKNPACGGSAAIGRGAAGGRGHRRPVATAGGD